MPLSEGRTEHMIFIYYHFFLAEIAHFREEKRRASAETGVLSLRGLSQHAVRRVSRVICQMLDVIY